MNNKWKIKNSTGTSYSGLAQDLILWPLLRNITNGFFVESGAADGETNSNTLFYELKGWSGLLVEPDPYNFADIRSLQRSVYLFHGCLSPSGRAELAVMQRGFNWETGGISPKAFLPTSRRRRPTYSVIAMPIGGLLDKIGRSTIDFWSLDIEGFEGPVLETMDFSKIEVGVLLVEMDKGPKNDEMISRVMDNNGFRRIGSTWRGPNRWEHGQQRVDGIFVNPKYFEARGLQVPTHL